MKRAPRSRQRHDLYAKYHDCDSEISDLLGECGFKEPKVRIVPKNIAPETIKDQDFKKKVEVAFRKRNAPESLIQSLFEDFDAAPAPATQTR